MRLLQLCIIFNIFLISFFNSIGSINLVDFNIFISQTLSSSLSIDFEMVRIFHCFGWRAIVLATWIESAELLLCLFLVEDVQVRAVGCLNSDNQALVV